LANCLQRRVRRAAGALCLVPGVVLCFSAGARAAPDLERVAGRPATIATERVSARPSASQPAAAPVAPVVRLARAFQPRAAGEPLSERVARARAEASRMGMWNAEPAARGLLLADGLGSDVERSRAAVLLAPDLPAAWGALALASPGLGFGPALLRGLAEMERNLDASVWWRATAWHVLAWGLFAGSLLFLVVSAIWLAPTAAHDLSHRLPGQLPAHAWAAVLASVGILPAALGEGLAGLAVGALVVALPWSTRRHRATLLAAGAAALAAVHPVTAESGRWIAALRADPETVAIRDADVGGLARGQRTRLEARAPQDPAASHALALWSKRVGRLGDAQHWLDLASVDESTNPVLLNDAANVRLAAGDSRAAIDFYERAAHARADAAIFFNLAQVHGSRIELTGQEDALEAAHATSEATLRELLQLRGDDRLAVDLPWPVADLRARLARAADGRAVAAALRRPFGTGRLVAEPLRACGFLLLIVILGSALGRGRIESRVCGACHARRCGRCAERPAGACRLCGASGSAASPLSGVARSVRPLALRLVPGLAGLVARMPFLGWGAAVAAALATAAWVERAGVVPDPLAAGALGPLAFTLVSAFLVACWAGSTHASLRSLR